MSNRLSFQQREQALTGSGWSYSKLAPLAFGIVILLIAFLGPIKQWVGFCWNSELYSHCLLIPIVSAYFIWIKRPILFAAGRRLEWLGILPVLGALILLGLCRWLRQAQATVAIEDYLAMTMGAFFLLVIGLVLFTLGRNFVSQSAFAFCFLIFAMPWPNLVMNAVMAFLQHRSADMSEVFLRLSGMTVFRDGTFFALPGFKMEVAPECSGIHSTLALFISSLAAGHMLLPRWRSRMFLALAVLPLALLRNALRIFTISLLCVYVDPEMIHAYIHRRGGPIFFAFSLIPLFLLLLYLRKNDIRGREEGSLG